MQCHGSTTLSATREFASVASAIAAFAASTAAFVPRTLNSPGGAGCPPGKADKRFVPLRLALGVDRGARLLADPVDLLAALADEQRHQVGAHLDRRRRLRLVLKHGGREVRRRWRR